MLQNSRSSSLSYTMIGEIVNGSWDTCTCLTLSKPHLKGFSNKGFQLIKTSQPGNMKNCYTLFLILFYGLSHLFLLTTCPFSPARDVLLGRQWQDIAVTQSSNQRSGLTKFGPDLNYSMSAFFLAPLLRK